MPIKTFGIYGKSSALLYVFHNGHKVKVHFSNGIPDPLINRPATVTVSDPFALDAIEHDPRYGKLIRQIGPATPTPAEKAAAEGKGRAKAVKAEPEKAKGEPRVYSGVTNLNAAREILMDLGANASQCAKREDAKATAISMNVEFPDWL